jgi:hypothetical protein
MCRIIKVIETLIIKLFGQCTDMCDGKKKANLVAKSRKSRKTLQESIISNGKD